jgi:hypothetical protein
MNVIAGLKKCSPFNRIIRVCLFDGLNFVGNAHAFLGAKAINEEDPWVFVNKVPHWALNYGFVASRRCSPRYDLSELTSLVHRTSPIVGLCV